MSEKKEESKAISRRRYLKYGAAAAVVAAAAAGGAYYLSLPTPTPTVTPTATPTVTPTATAVRPEKYGDVIKFTMVQEPTTLDPAYVSLYVEYYVDNNLYDTLLIQDGDLKIRPWAAKSYDVVSDTELVFHLRDDMYFHNGRKVIAADWKYTIERNMDPKTGSTSVGYTKSWDRVEAPDDVTLRILLKEPSASILFWLAFSSYFGVVPKEAVAQYGDLKIHPVGTGPFKFKRWIKGSRIELERFDKYWQVDKDGLRMPYADGMEYYFQPDTDVSLTNLKTGFVNYMQRVGYKDIKDLKADNRFLMEVPGGYSWYCVWINTKRKPWDDVRMRRAIAHAINKDDIINLVYYGTVAKGIHPVPSYSPWYYEPPGVAEYDPAAAKKLLADAGYPDGLDETLISPMDVFPDMNQCEVIVDQLKKVGIRLKYTPMEVGAYIQKTCKEHDFSLSMHGMSEIWDPDFLMLPFHSGAFWNLPQWYAVDDLLDQQSKILDFDKRKAVVAQILTKIVEDYPVVVMNFYAHTRASAGYVQGWTPAPPQPLEYHYKTYLDKKLKEKLGF